MLDVAIIEQCADPSVDIAIVERFMSAVGLENPLAISITNGDRIILPEPPGTPHDAVRLAQRFVGTATVRAGVTHFPVGVGISDASEITTELFDVCSNIAMGTALFGKVYRIVSHAAGAENGAVLQDAVDAWRSGQFAGDYIFAVPDPGPHSPPAIEGINDSASAMQPPGDETVVEQPLPVPDGIDPHMAGIRVELPAILTESGSTPIEADP